MRMNLFIIRIKLYLLANKIKFKKFTCMNLTTFDCILNEIGESIRSQDTNFRKNIAPAEKLLVSSNNNDIIIY